MKKTLHTFILLSLLLLSSSAVLFSKELGKETEYSEQTKTSRYIQFVYNKIKFSKSGKLSYQVFKHAFYGYLNMLEAGKLSNGALLTICDFTMSSNKKRMWVIDVVNKKLLFNNLVAHGMGTGEEFATMFSNTEDSHQSSLGFYTTGETYLGNNGYSLKLHGEDGCFNSKAFDRAIVIHGAEYVSEKFACENDRLGRSHGCPALPVDLAPKIIDKIKNGTCLFIYHTANNYLQTSYWLKSKVKHLPMEADLMDFDLPNSSSTCKDDIHPHNEVGLEEKHHSLPNVEKKVQLETNDKRIISSIIVVNETAIGSSDTLQVK